MDPNSSNIELPLLITHGGLQERNMLTGNQFQIKDMLKDD